MAAQNGHADAVRLLLADERVDPSVRDNFAVKVAAQNGHADIVRLLLAAKRVDPAAGDNEAIRAASYQGHRAVVELLLADPRVDPSANDNVALCEACLEGHLAVVNRLLSDSRISPAADAIGHAAANGHAAVVARLLADARVDPAAMDNAAIVVGAQEGHSDVVAVLLADKRVDPSARDNHAVRMAAQNGHADAVRFLLADERVDPSAEDNFAVKVAAQNGHADVVRLLLAAKRVDPAVDDNEAIRAASYQGHRAVVKLLLQDARTDPAAADNAAINGAAAGGHSATVDSLLADPRVDPSAGGNAAIAMASAEGHTDVIDRLLRDPRVDPSVDDNAPIYLAAGGGHVAAVDRLLADPRVSPAAYGNRALAIAVINGHADVVQRLLAGPRVDPSFRGGIILPLAALQGRTDVVMCLLADPRVDPSAGDYAALKLAAEMGHTDVVKCLLDHSRAAAPFDDAAGAIMGAAMEGHADVVSLMLADRRALQPEAVTSLGLVNYLVAVSAAFGSMAVLNMLLSNADFVKHVDPVVVSESLARAIDGDDEETAERLVRFADPHINPQCALQVAVAQGWWDTAAQLLADERVDPSRSDNATKVIGHYARAGDVAAVKRLLENPRLRAQRFSCLMDAAVDGHMEAVELLLSVPGTRPSALSRESFGTGWAALAAFASGHRSVAKRLCTESYASTAMAVLFLPSILAAPLASQLSNVLLQPRSGLRGVDLMNSLVLLACTSMICDAGGRLAESAFAGLIFEPLASASSAAIVEAEAPALSHLKAVAARMGVGISIQPNTRGLQARSDLLFSRMAASIVRGGNAVYDTTFVRKFSYLNNLCGSAPSEPGRIPPGLRWVPAFASASAGAPPLALGQIVMPPGLVLRASSLARELGRAMQPTLLQDMNYIFKTAKAGVVGMSVLMCMASEQESGLACALLGSACAAPLVLAESDAARRGFRLMRDAGMSRLSALRCFATVAPGLAIAAMPLFAYFAKHRFIGFNGSRHRPGNDHDEQGVPPPQAALAVSGKRPFADLASMWADHRSFLGGALAAVAAGRAAAATAATAAVDAPASEAAVVQALTRKAALYDIGVAQLPDVASASLPVSVSESAAKPGVWASLRNWVAHLRVASLAADDAMCCFPSASGSVSVMHEAMMHRLGKTPSPGGDLLFIGDIRASALARGITVGTSHPLMRRVMQPEASPVRPLDALSKWGARGFGFAALLAGDEDTGLRIAQAGGAASIPLLASEWQIAISSSSLLRKAGASSLASLRAFAWLPTRLGVALAPLAGHFTKKHFGGYKSSASDN